MTKEQEMAIQSMRKNNIGYVKIAKALGLTRDNVRNYCVYHGLNGQRAEYSSHDDQPGTKSVEDIQQEVGDVWTVLDKRRGCECSSGVAEVTLRCNICGAIRLARLSTITKIVCMNCRANEAEARKLKEEEIRKQKQRLKAERKEARYKQQTFGLYKCKQCGEWFASAREKKYCSSRCSRKSHDKRSELKRRARMQSQIVDDDISLQKLYARDGGICYICGRRCDWNDSEWKDGVYYTGETYPSIDHVIALANGGAHSWANVMLACRRCNSLKRDR